ncbi:MAG: hypothetical protein U9N42_04395, partial [Campylobacterota bacterium]|nr:hypothetical protein [Campylobacterota bacterium]
MKHLLYIYDDNSDLEETIKESSLFEDIFFNYTHIDEFLKNPNRYIKQDSVLLLHLEDSFFNDIFKIAIPHELTISFLPKKNQKNITNTYKLEKSLDLQFKNIVESKEHSVDIICIDNRSYILNEIAFGEIPIFNSIQKQTIKDGFFSKS